MIKDIFFQIMNSFRLVAFWLMLSLTMLGLAAAISEMKVTVTVEDAVLGDRINHYASGQEFYCMVNGKRIVVFDTENRNTGDEVQLIFRDGNYYAIRSSKFPDVGVGTWERVSYRFTSSTGGNVVFVVIAYIVLTLLTIRSRTGFRKEYKILAIVTHVFGLIFTILFFLTAFWLDVQALIVYAVLFGVICIIWVIVHNVNGKRGRK